MSIQQKMMLDEAIRLMNSGEVEEAEELLVEALEISGELDFYVRNNLGTLLLLRGAYDAAYEIMYENKQAVGKVNPYYYAKMAVICIKLDKTGEASRMLKSGTKLYENGNKKYAPDVWDEYGFTLLQAYMVLSKYKDGLKLYRNNMKHSEYNQIHLIATRMAISLNRLKQAEVYARKTRSPGTVDLVEGFKKGLLPVMDVFMDYGEYFGEKEDVFLMFAILISDQVSLDEKCEVAKYLILSLDKGSDLADKIFNNDYYDLKIKHAALEALGELGLYTYGTYKTIIYQGEEVNLFSGRIEIREDDLISYGILNEVEDLNVDEALKVINEYTTRNCITSPSIMEKEIELFRLKGFDDSAEVLLNQLEAYRNARA
ncbi:hypothetical protein EZV73_20515 [Acidaminobacter sp. JC074]|uniref:tetratricopeptide repeat protein n=1 Tax=Acidaminobacter sp. JC074 TaxID=2530199 RepID=UPI001F0D4DDC|nr:hypothetical protein [Acidaminobacter sp. JC074]MCH4889975.1 hypothetical protein [Acidaminobacter sp. JC074]